jgi:hypothetical protein
MKISKVETFKPVTITLESEGELKALKEIVVYMGERADNINRVYSYYNNYHIDHCSDVAKTLRRTLRDKL